MPGYIIEARRTELIYFRVNAENPEDAESRYLTDGEEIGSDSPSEPDVLSVTLEG